MTMLDRLLSVIPFLQMGKKVAQNPLRPALCFLLLCPTETQEQKYQGVSIPGILWFPLIASSMGAGVAMTTPSVGKLSLWQDSPTKGGVESVQWLRGALPEDQFGS